MSFVLLFSAMMMEKEKQAWIGMSDTATKGGFQFVDGTPYVYTDWSFESYEWLYAHPNDARSKCITCLLYTSPSPRDATLSLMPSSA